MIVGVVFKGYSDYFGVIYRRITILILCIFCSIDYAIAQTNFVIEGTAESKFEGTEVHLISPDTSFEGEKLPVQQG